MRSRKVKRYFAPHSLLFARMFPWGLPDNGLDGGLSATMLGNELPRGPGRRRRNAEQNSSTDNNNWLQCDSCNKWRLVGIELFERLSKEAEFKCTVLIGTLCEDQDDYERFTKDTDSPNLQPRTMVAGGDTKPIKRRKSKSHKRNLKPNAYADPFIPGFGAPLSP
jgi:hypothetical protein